MTTTLPSRLIGALAVAAILAGASAAFAADVPVAAPVAAPTAAPAVVPAAPPSVKASAAVPAHPVAVAPAHTATAKAAPSLAGIANALDQARAALADKKYGEARSVLSHTVTELNAVRKASPRAEHVKITGITREVKAARTALRHGEHQDALAKVDAALAALKAIPAAPKS